MDPNETHTPAGNFQNLSLPKNLRACTQYWRIYFAWVNAGEKERPTWLARLRDHLGVCGCRMGLGGRTPTGVRSEWSPMDEPIHEDEKAGGWDVQS